MSAENTNGNIHITDEPAGDTVTPANIHITDEPLTDTTAQTVTETATVTPANIHITDEKA
ncbi:hypothetical protein ACFV2H_41080 [Streptomyces sp. NPDC059629]|uniref:hypothetical protein n=1 Tax=Streptomyces sp. NPDC059629 TaxID=3346889 RepID=UPI0036A4BCDF